LLGALKEGGSGTTSDRQRLRSLLVLSEVSLRFVLLIGAGLLIPAFIGMLRVDCGFDPAHVLTFQISLPQVRYPEQQEAALSIPGANLSLHGRSDYPVNA